MQSEVSLVSVNTIVGTGKCLDCHGVVANGRPCAHCQRLKLASYNLRTGLAKMTRFLMPAMVSVSDAQPKGCSRMCLAPLSIWFGRRLS
jgi:hypothetical protein